jgi:hypothetical protein
MVVGTPRLFRDSLGTLDQCFGSTLENRDRCLPHAGSESVIDGFALLQPFFSKSRKPVGPLFLFFLLSFRLLNSTEDTACQSRT